jgi:glycosyltransferase involved in cell wall biosynthesis
LLAVSGACFAIRREVFDRVGGFSETPAFPRLDIDLCLKVVLDAGLRIVYNPFARMWQDEEALLERALPGDGAAYVRATFPEGDPYFNPNLVSKGRAPRDHNYAEEARALVQAFDSVPAEIEESIASCTRARGGDGHFVWFIPDFQNGFYGGIHTILRFADYFRIAHGVRSTFAVLGHAHPAAIQRRIARVSPDLAASSTVESIDSYAGLSRLAPAEAVIATLWTTAYFALRFNKAREKFYFLQDQESLFYPAGTTSALADATWGFGFKGICNTVTLRDLYVQRGGRGEFFSPCIDPEVFYPSSARAIREPYTLFCYARPHHARNCFELICEAIRILKRRMGDRVSIVTAGDEWEPARFGLGGLVENLGLLSYRSTGALYRSCDAGLVMMATAHPSYLPLELMACGSLVVTNENPKTAWLLRDRVNCMLAGTTPGALAAVVEEGLRDRELRRRITEHAARMVRDEYSNWNGAAEKVFAYMRAAERVVARGQMG